MKKIPTIFVRDWEGDRSRVLPGVNPGCEWVSAGEGMPTRKFDGTACLMRQGKLFKRRELRAYAEAPVEFETIEVDPETKKTVGWVPVGDGPEDQYHREAFAADPFLPDGTYELIGPKIQGNPERSTVHRLIRHGSIILTAPRDFEGLREFFSHVDCEGVVFHHPDGRMAKIKGRDFGCKRRPI